MSYRSVTALRVLEYSAPPVWTGDTPLPDPAPGDVLVEIRAAALNFADLLMIEGRYQDTPAAPFTLGLEAAGVVRACGADVRNLAPGDRVAVHPSHGAFATAGCFPAGRCIKLPDAVDFVTAATLPIAYGTSHLALEYKARLRPGERLVVTGAAGGVGLTAVEIGKIMGAEVVAIARGADKREIARAAGADQLVDAEAPDIRERLKTLGGADVVYDVVGGTLFDACFRATRPDGRMLLIGFAGGALPELRPNHMLVKNITVSGFYWAVYSQINPAAFAASLDTVFRWAAEGRIRPHISHRFAFAEAADALDLLRSREATGKIVLEM